MSFRYRSDQIQEIVSAQKRLRNPGVLSNERPLPFKTHGQGGRRLDLDPDAPCPREGSYCDRDDRKTS